MAYEGYKYSFKNQFRTMASLTVYRTGRQQCTANYTRGLEVRDFYLIHYVIKGAGTYILNGVSYPVREGQAFLIYPNMPINYRADADDPWEFCWVGFNGTDARRLVSMAGFTQERPVLHGLGDEVQRLLLRISEVSGNTAADDAAMVGCLYLFLAQLIRQNARTAGTRSTPATCSRPASPGAISQPRSSTRRAPNACSMPAPPSLVALPPSPIYRVFAPARTARSISSPTP